MLLLTQSSLFLISRLPCFILFPLCQRLREMLYLCVCLKCMNYFSGFMAFWSRLFQASGKFSMYFAHLFNSVSRQCHEVWTSQFPFLHSLKEVIPPVSMTVLIGLWHRLILWVCLSPFLLKGVARSDHRLGSNSQYRRDLCWGLCQGLVKRASLPKQPPLGSGNEAHLHGKTSVGGTVSTSSTESRRKGGHGDWCS